MEVPVVNELTVEASQEKEFSIAIPEYAAEFFLSAAKGSEARVPVLLRRAIDVYVRAQLSPRKNFTPDEKDWRQRMWWQFCSYTEIAFEICRQCDRPISRQGVQHWFKTGRVPHWRIPDIEKITRGKVTRHDIDPDHYGLPPDAYRAPSGHAVARVEAEEVAEP